MSDNMDMVDAYSLGDFDDLRELSLMIDPESLRLYWTTEDKQQLFIEDMETSHIENIIRAGIDGRMNCDKHTENRFLLELSIRRRLKEQGTVKTIENLPF